jgi:hypothetical protein
MRIVIPTESFRGKNPQVSPYKLPNDFAQEAVNCYLDSGDLRPLKSVSDGVALGSDDIRSVFKMEDGTLLTWDTDVDVVSSFVNDDDGRIFYTDGVYPKQTNQALDPNYRRLGVAAPAEALNIQINGTAESENIMRTTAYVYTYVTEFGEESRPCESTAVFDLYEGQSVTLSNFILPVISNLTIEKFRIYRLLSGSTSAEYQLVAEVANTTTTYTDSVDEGDLAEVLPTETWDNPPDNLVGLAMAANGVLFGWSGRYVYFSEPFIPYAFPTDYIQQLNSDIVGAGFFSDYVVVLTKDIPYISTSIDPAAATLNPLSHKQACTSKHSIVSTGFAVIYSSPDGLFLIGDTDTGGKLITDGIISREQWQQYDIENILAFYHEGRYVGFFKEGNTGFIYDLNTGFFTDFTLSGIDAVYDGFIDTSADVIRLVCKNGANYYLYDFNSGEKLTYTWKSKKYQLPQAINFSIARVDADFDGDADLQLKVYADGELKFTKTVTSSKPFRLPGGFRSKVWEVELIGNDSIRSVILANSVEEAFS